MAKKPTTAKDAPASVAPTAPASAPQPPAAPAETSTIAPAATADDLRARLGAQLEELAAERGVTPDEVIAFARDLLAGSAENIKLTSTATVSDAKPLDGLETVTVIGPAAGLRRAGFQFGATPLVIDVTPEQKALIAADARLSFTLGGSAPALAANIQRERPALGRFKFEANGTVEVKVIGPAGGRRRAGFNFGSSEQQVRVSRAQLEQLLGDADLAVNAA